MDLQRLHKIQNNPKNDVFTLALICEVNLSNYESFKKELHNYSTVSTRKNISGTESNGFDLNKFYLWN